MVEMLQSSDIKIAAKNSQKNLKNIMLLKFIVNMPLSGK